MGSTPNPDQSGQTPESQTTRGIAPDDQQREVAGGRGTSSDEDLPAPPYSETYGEMDLRQGGFGTSTRIAEDGRVNIDINETSKRLSAFLAPVLDSQAIADAESLPPPYIPTSLGGQGGVPPPPLNLVIQVVGSRGDVQPFVALGQVLQKTYGHRVRLATHPTFKKFVEENELEFFSIGGDPAELMAFMVKNPGLMPGFDSLRNGDIGKRRKEITEIVTGCWRSCFEAGDGSGVPISDANLEAANISDGSRPFVADAIIANPPSFAHLHCAEKLGIPLHLMFTMPWSPTQAFPHPLANITSTNADPRVTNVLSYSLVEMMTWQGLGDVINKFRQRSLGLEPVSIMWAPGMIPRLQIPYTYCWSPALIPKPNDWANYIDIAGFFFLPLASNYTPPDDLATFLDAGPPPVYIGFGSIVVDDPDAMTKMIFEAVKKTGQRALVSKGWGGFGAEDMGIPEGVFMLGNCPHDWLFKRVSCVVHHGGAGTTAAGIALGRPTVIVPFFGDQPFWGSMVAKAGAGPEPTPYKQLTADKLAASIMEALTPTALQKAGELGARISEETGSNAGAQSFHKHLKTDTLRCDIAASRVAVWRVKRTNVKLSAFAVTTLSGEGLLELDDLKMYRPREYDTEPGPKDPITGGAAALIGSIGHLATGFTDIPSELLKALPAEGSSKKSKSKSKSKSTQPSDPPHSPSQNTSMANLTSDSRDQSVSSLPISTVDSNTTRTTSIADETRSEAGKRNSSAENQDQRRSTPRDGPGPVTPSTIIETTRVASNIFNMGFKSQSSFSLGVSKGFHNAPKLYGDDTVRDIHKVTGIQSGFKAAGKEFGYGVYDGITGLVTQPIRGGRKEGAVGALKGFGKGLAGVVLKPSAGAWAIPGYTMSGLFKEMQKNFGTKVEKYIVVSRSAQGYEEWVNSTLEERADVVKRWQVIKADLDAKAAADKGGFFGSRKPTKEEKKMLKAAEKGESSGSLSRRQSSFRDVFGSKKHPAQPHSQQDIPKLQNKEHTVQHSKGSPFSGINAPPPPFSSSAEPPPSQFEDDGDADFHRALEESRLAHEQAEEQQRRERTEMDVVMEYAKKQSLAEEAFRRQASTGGAGGSGSGNGNGQQAEQEEDEDEAALRKATEESLKF